MWGEVDPPQGEGRLEDLHQLGRALDEDHALWCAFHGRGDVVGVILLSGLTTTEFVPDLLRRVAEHQPDQYVVLVFGQERT